LPQHPAWVRAHPEKRRSRQSRTRSPPLPCRHVLSRHSIPEHGTRGDGFRAARMAARPSVDPLRPLRVRSSLSCRRTVSAGDGREARRWRCPRPLRVLERQARAGYRPGRLKHHDRQPRQRRVCQSRSAPPRGRRHGRHMPLWRGYPQREAHPTVDRQQKGARLHGAVDGRKQARGCKRTYRIQHRLSTHPRAFRQKHPGFHERAGTI
jgi:Protein of unknown function (DUF328)